MGRIFGPAVEKAMPVMLKVAFGSMGVLFVAALVLVYSDKRFGDGWGHAEAMAFMFQRAAGEAYYIVFDVLTIKTRIHHQYLLSGRGTTGTAFRNKDTLFVVI